MLHETKRVSLLNSKLIERRHHLRIPSTKGSAQPVRDPQNEL